MATAPPTRIKTTGWSGTTRLTLGADGLLAESRDMLTGAWSPARQIFYDEILAVYTYRLPDWEYLIVAGIYGVLGLTLLGIAGVAGDARPGTWALGLGLLACLVIALAAYRIFIVQRSLVRLDTVTGAFTFPSSQDSFVQQLVSTLGADAPPAGAPSQPAAAADSPPATSAASPAGAPAPPPSPAPDLAASPGSWPAPGAAPPTPAATVVPPASDAVPSPPSPPAPDFTAPGPAPAGPPVPEPAAAQIPAPEAAPATAEESLASRWAWRPEPDPAPTPSPEVEEPTQPEKRDSG